jgi:hypothetical protein
MRFPRHYNVIGIKIEDMSIGYITNALIFIQKSGINKEYEQELKKELKKRTIKYLI